MLWVMKLVKNRVQHRITIPRELIKWCGWENVEVVRLRGVPDGKIIIEEYHGKSKEEGDLPED